MVPLVLTLAIGSGVSGTLLTRVSQGFKRWGFGLGGVLAYAIATVLLAWLVQQMPVGVVYAIWTGSAAVVLLVIDRMFFAVRIRPLQLVGMLAVLSGVVLLSFGASQ
jgi:small multidrug resistance pump